MSSGLLTGYYEGVKWVRGVVGFGMFALKVYLYLVDDILVDTGPSRLSRKFTGFFKEENIDTVLLTHYHEDHTGNAPYLAHKGIPHYINTKTVEVCRKEAVMPGYRRLYWGKRSSFPARPLSELLEGNSLDLEAIETPGHCADQITYYFPERGIVFTGDLFVTPKPKIILRSENVLQTIEDLENVLSRDFDTVMCGHAGVVQEGRALMKRKLDYLVNLKGEVLHLHRKGWTAGEIRKKMYPRPTFLECFSGGEWSPSHLVNSIIHGELVEGESPVKRISL